jgi:hypothetical protein
MRRVTRITAPILSADIGDHCFGVFSLDLKSSDERIFGVHSHVFGVSIQLKSDGKLHSHVFLMRYFGSDVSKPCVAKRPLLACPRQEARRPPKPAAVFLKDGEMFASLDFLSARDVEHLYSMQLIQDSPGQKLGLNWWRSSRQITRDPPRASPICPD